MNRPLQMQRIVAVLCLALSAAGGAIAADKPEEPAAEPPKKLAVGIEGLFQPGLLLQGWYIYNRASGVDSNTFRIRRAEINVKGEIIPGLIAYGLMFDPARVREPVNTTLPVAGAPNETVVVRQFMGPGSIFQDVFITAISPYADVSLGQFKIPVSWEGYNSSSKLVFPERSLVAGAYGDRRDVGIRVAKTFKSWGYSFGVFNGALQNNLDTNNSKDVTLRLEAYPVSGLTLAAVGYASIGERLSATTKDRWEFDARYERGPFLFQSEYIHARDGGGPNWVEAHGFYALFGYMVTDKLQPVVRVGYLDPNLAVDLDPFVSNGADEAWELNAGINYYFQKHEAKLQLAYQRVQHDVRPARNEVILAAQVGF